MAWRGRPEKFFLLMETWKKHHPEWEYKLWTDSDMELFPFTNRKAFDLAKNLRTKADILKYEILYIQQQENSFIIEKGD